MNDNITSSCALHTTAGPLYLWSMFPAENLWSWLARMIGNRANAESCMMFAWHDKQFIDLHFWNESSADLPEFKDPTQYIADPSKAKPKAAGAVIKNAIRTQDITSLVWFYVEYMPVLTAMWVEVVSRYIRDHTRKQVADLHIKRPKAGGFKFNTAPWMSNFFTHHFCGKHQPCMYVHNDYGIHTIAFLSSCASCKDICHETGSTECGATNFNTKA